MLTGNHNKELPTAVRLALGFIIFCIAWLLRWALLPVEAGVAFLTFYPAMMVSYFLFGVGAGALTTILGAVIGYYVFTPPFWTFEHNQQGVLATAIYLISSVLVGFIVWRLKQHRDQLNVAIESEKLSHARYEALYVATPAMLHSIDSQGKIIITSDAWLRTLGYARDEVVGRHITDFLTQESKERALQVNIPKFFATGTATDLPYQMVTKDGHVLDVLLSAVTDTIDPHEIRRSMAAIVNITEQKKAESLLTQSEAQYRFLVEGQSELISLSSPKGTLAFVNQSYALHYGYDTKSLLGRSLYDLVPEAQRKSVEDHLLQVQATLTCSRNINQVCSANGELSWVSWTNNPMLSADGSFLGIHSVGRDITLQIHAQTALRQSQTELQLLMDNIPGLVSNLDVNLRYRFVNKAYQEWFGVEPASLIGVSLAEFYGDQVFSAIEPYLRQALTGETVVSERDVPASGVLRHCHVVLIPQRDKDHQVVGLFVMQTDISARKKIEADLAESHELLRVTLESIGDAVITTDAKGVVVWLNPVAELMTGWGKEDAQGLPLDTVFHIVNAVTRRPSLNPVNVCLNLKKSVGLQSDTVLIGRDGKEFGIEDSASPIRNSDGVILGAVLVFHDVSEQQRLSREMTHRATHDGLTGLVNRVEFEARLSRALGQSKLEDSTHVLMFIDLDEFKVVNDACGHAAGDQLLRYVSSMLQSNVRGQDTVARLGGDEFGLLLEGCSQEQGRNIAQKICDQMETYRFLHDQKRYRIGTSIGVVRVDARWDGLPELLQAADTCCYAAKNAGRNRVHLWLETNDMALARNGEAQWVARIVSALDENQFMLFAQRIVPLRQSETGLHCEVLIRLPNANGSMVLPGVFIPAAERFHLASRIDRWVLQKVIDLLGATSTVIDSVDMIAINLSGQSVGDKAFHREALQMIERALFDVSKLCFEITETAAISNMVDAMVFIEEVRALGVRVALDDFGAGASSFGYLRTLPVDFLKIDGQFVTRMLEDPLDHSAVRCFAEVARVVGVKTIAEFVEKEEVRTALVELGVDYAQGFLVHRPQPLSTLLVEAGNTKQVKG